MRNTYVKNPLSKAPLLSFASPRSGEWLCIDRFDTPIKAILYDGDQGKTIIIEAKNGKFERTEINGVITLKGMTWPNSRHFFKLEWTEEVANEDTAKNAVYPAGHPKAGQKKYVSYKKFLKSEVIIGTRREDDVPYIRQKEVHPVAISFLCRGGGSYTIVVQVTVEVHNPMAAIQVEDFLSVPLGKVTEAIGNWGRSITYEEAQLINVDSHKQITIEDENGVKHFYRDYINIELEKKLGITVSDVTTLDSFVGDGSIEIFNSATAALAAINKKKERLELNLATEAENATNLKYQTQLLDKIKEVGEALLGKQAEVAKNFAGTNGLQYLNLGGDNKIGFDAMEMLALLTEGKRKKGGGANANT